MGEASVTQVKNKRTARLTASKDAFREIPEKQRPLPEYMSLPASQYSVLGEQHGAGIRTGEACRLMSALMGKSRGFVTFSLNESALLLRPLSALTHASSLTLLADGRKVERISDTTFKCYVGQVGITSLLHITLYGTSSVQWGLLHLGLINSTLADAHCTLHRPRHSPILLQCILQTLPPPQPASSSNARAALSLAPHRSSTLLQCILQSQLCPCKPHPAPSSSNAHCTLHHPLPQLKFLQWYAEPVVTLSVDVEPGGCTIKLLSCELRGSPFVEDLNNRFESQVCV